MEEMELINLKEKIFTYIYNGNNSERQFYCYGNDKNNYDDYGMFRSKIIMKLFKIFRIV